MRGKRWHGGAASAGRGAGSWREPVGLAALRVAAVCLLPWIGGCAPPSPAETRGGDGVAGGSAVDPDSARSPHPVEGVPSAEAPDPARRMIVIGLDGANWEVLVPLLDAGRVPALASLIAEGASAILWSRSPMVTPALWTTILTGRGREAHGIEGFSGVDPRTGEIVASQSWMRRVPAIWNVLNHLGVRTGIAGAHVTWPAERVDGFLVTRRASWSHDPRSAWPPELLEEVGDGRVGELDALIVDRGVAKPGDPDRRYEFFRDFWTEDHAAFDLALAHADRSDPGFLFVYFHVTDVAQHLFWPSDASPGDPGAAGGFEPIFAVYEHVDRLVGELLAKVRGPDTAVMVVSDHGAKAGGYLELFERDTDRLLAAMGVLEYRPGGGGRPEVDPERSAMLLGPEVASLIRVRVNRRNALLADREDLRRGLARKVARDLAALRMLRSGRPLFRNVHVDGGGSGDRRCAARDPPRGRRREGSRRRSRVSPREDLSPDVLPQ